MKETSVHIKKYVNKSQLCNLRFEILLWLSGCEIFSGPSRNGLKVFTLTFHKVVFGCKGRTIIFLERGHEIFSFANFLFSFCTSANIMLFEMQTVLLSYPVCNHFFSLSCPANIFSIFFIPPIPSKKMVRP